MEEDFLMTFDFYRDREDIWKYLKDTTDELNKLRKRIITLEKTNQKNGAKNEKRKNTNKA